MNKEFISLFYIHDFVDIWRFILGNKIDDFLKNLNLIVYKDYDQKSYEKIQKLVFLELYLQLPEKKNLIQRIFNISNKEEENIQKRINAFHFLNMIENATGRLGQIFIQSESNKIFRIDTQMQIAINHLRKNPDNKYIRNDQELVNMTAFKYLSDLAKVRDFLQNKGLNSLKFSEVCLIISLENEEELNNEEDSYHNEDV